MTKVKAGPTVLLQQCSLHPWEPSWSYLRLIQWLARSHWKKTVRVSLLTQLDVVWICTKELPVCRVTSSNKRPVAILEIESPLCAKVAALQMCAGLLCIGFPGFIFSWARFELVKGVGSSFCKFQSVSPGFDDNVPESRVLAYMSRCWNVVSFTCANLSTGYFHLATWYLVAHRPRIQGHLLWWLGEELVKAVNSE